MKVGKGPLGVAVQVVEFEGVAHVRLAIRAEKATVSALLDADQALDIARRIANAAIDLPTHEARDGR